MGAGLEEGRVEEGNGSRHGRSDGKRGGRERAEEGATERGRGPGRSVGGREIEREGNFKG